MRLPWTAVAGGALVVAVGAAGLIRGAMPQSADAGSTTPSAPIVVTGAFIRPPVPPNDEAAAYFTVYNTTDKADVLQSVQTGAGSTSVLHTDSGGTMTVTAGGVTVPAHGKIVLSVGQGHVMIGGLYGALDAGDSVNMQLQFQNNGEVDTVATVVPFGQPAPTGSAADSASPSSGAHS